MRDHYIDFDNYLGSQDWGRKKSDYTSGNLDYFGKHLQVTGATSDDQWHILKFTYDGSGNLTDIQGPLVGVWDDRATLGWS